MLGFIKRSYHGGHCCGMTHILDFSYDPAQVLDERKIKTPEEWATFVKSYAGYARVKNEGLPKQTGKERLTEIVGRITHERPRGCIEVTMIGSQVTAWGEILKELGFKAVNKFLNSNSSNGVTVFHLDTGDQ